MIDIEGSHLVQHFADRGRSHRRKGAASRIIDMVWILGGRSQIYT
jgi:hypothetical protein